LTFSVQVQLEQAQKAIEPTGQVMVQLVGIEQYSVEHSAPGITEQLLSA